MIDGALAFFGIILTLQKSARKWHSVPICPSLWLPIDHVFCHHRTVMKPGMVAWAQYRSLSSRPSVRVTSVLPTPFLPRVDPGV